MLSSRGVEHRAKLCQLTRIDPCRNLVSFQKLGDLFHDRVIEATEAPPGYTVEKGEVAWWISAEDRGPWVDQLTETISPTDGPGEHEIEADLVVDASGRHCFLARRLRLRQRVEEHPTAAVWARWQGVADLDGRGDLEVFGDDAVADAWAAVAP